MAIVDIDIVDGVGQDATVRGDRRDHPGALRVTTLGDMVFRINARLGTNQMRRLRIFGHAGPGVQGLGNSRTTNNPNQLLQVDASGRVREAALLVLLRSSFDANGWAELHGCEVARGWNGKMLLAQLCHIWGVQVRGGVNDQFAPPGFEGPVRRASPATDGGTIYR